MSARIPRSALALALPMLTLALAPAALADEFPRDAASAMAYYEADVDRWLDGPVQYIVLEAERDLFQGLKTSAERAAFVQWFWARRDADARDGVNAFQTEFYDRVASANTRYHDFPHGWRSDRGMLHVVLGRPDAIRPELGLRADATTWTYYTVGPQARDRQFGTALGEMTVAFVKSPGRGGYQLYGGFAGAGSMPLYVRDAIDYSIQAAIADPYLELSVD